MMYILTMLEMIGFLDILPFATNNPNGREKSKVRMNIFRLVTVPASICSKRFPMQVSYKMDSSLEKKETGSNAPRHHTVFLIFRQR